MLMLSFGISMESGGVYSQTSFKELSVMWEGDVSSVTQTTANRNHCQPGFCAIGSFEACHSHNHTCTGSVWGLTRWWRNSSVCSSTFHGCCVGATSVLLQTPTEWHLLLLSVGQGKPAGSLQGRGRQCAHLPAPKPAGLLGVRAKPKSLLMAQVRLCWPCPSSCLPDWAIDCIPLTHVFMGRACWVISLFPWWGCGQLFSWRLPKHLPERAGMWMLCSRSVASLKSSSLCQKQRHYMWEISCREKKPNPFINMVHFFVCFKYFSSANYKKERLGRSSLLPPLWGCRPQKDSCT